MSQRCFVKWDTVNPKAHCGPARSGFTIGAALWLARDFNEVPDFCAKHQAIDHQLHLSTFTMNTSNLIQNQNMSYLIIERWRRPRELHSSSALPFNRGIQQLSSLPFSLTFTFPLQGGQPICFSSRSFDHRLSLQLFLFSLCIPISAFHCDVCRDVCRGYYRRQGRHR